MNKTDFINAINAVKANRAMSAEIDTLLGRFKELAMPFDLEFVSSTKTFGFQGGDAYNGGYSVICSVKDEGIELQVLFGTDSNEMVESLSNGDTLKEELKFVSYDPLYQRPIMGQVFSDSSLNDDVQNNGEEINVPDESDLGVDLKKSAPESQQPIENSLDDLSNDQGAGPIDEGAWGGADPDPAPASVSSVSASPASASPVSAPPASAPPVSASPVSASPVSASPVSIPQSSDPSASAGKGKLFACGLIAVALLVGAFILFFTFFSGGRSNVDTEWIYDSEREFTAIYTVNGVRAIETKLKYLGKSPNLPFQGKGPNYDWRSRRTDFYTSSMKNLTEYPIRLKSISYKLKKGTFSGTNPQYESYLKAYWTSTVIHPGQTVTRRNNWIWGKAQTNTLTKTYSVQIELGKDKVTDPADPFFPADSQVPVEFEVQFPLKFIR